MSYRCYFDLPLKFLANNLNLYLLLFGMCECNALRTMDLKTPRNVYLTAFYKRSFAFYTVKNRMPVILTNLIDNLARNKGLIINEYGKEVKDELKSVIGQLSEFKYEIQTNKPLRLLISTAPDAKLYNDYIEELTEKDGTPSYFNTIWLLAECYMYRRIRQIFEISEFLSDYDPFRSQKEESYKLALPMILQLGSYFLDLVQKDSIAQREEFLSLLKLNLWGNKCDLSLSLGQQSDHRTLFDTSSLDSFVLCDHSEQVWKVISDNTSSSSILDIIFDNAGYEVFTDLCLADYVISKNLATSVRLYVKTIPWFISDVTSQDLNWTLQQLKDNQNAPLRELGKRWSEYIQNGTWQVVESDFWTLPFDYSVMRKVDPSLYRKLAEAKLVLFKGDLNYRKLFGERNWDPVTLVEEALQNFHPTKLCTLRTVKADIVCGLKQGMAEKLDATDPKWMETGNWGVIQFSGKVVAIDE